MEIVPRKGFREPRSLRTEMENVWNEVFGEMPFDRVSREEKMPLLDISETESTLIIRAELPGVDAKDIALSICGDLLTLKGEKKKRANLKMQSN